MKKLAKKSLREVDKDKKTEGEQEASLLEKELGEHWGSTKNEIKKAVKEVEDLYEKAKIK